MTTSSLRRVEFDMGEWHRFQHAPPHGILRLRRKHFKCRRCFSSLHIFPARPTTASPIPYKQLQCDARCVMTRGGYNIPSNGAEPQTETAQHTT